MSMGIQALILFGTFALFLIIGIPISVSLGLCSAVLCATLQVPLAVLPQKMFTTLDSFTVMAIPLFILSGNLMTTGGIAKRLVGFADCLVGRIRGGMAIGAILACAFFAAVSGSPVATIMAVGSMLYGEMVERGYPPARMAGMLAVAGTIGTIIPPSNSMVIFGSSTGSSITDLFKAGMSVGIACVVILSAVTLIMAKKENYPKREEKRSLQEIGRITLSAIPAILMPVMILGGVFFGMFTPTECAAVACVYALVVGFFVYRELDIKGMFKCILDSAKSSAVVLFIMGTSGLFSWLFVYTGMSKSLIEAIVNLGLSPRAFLLMLGVIMLFLGTFMEGTAMILLVTPLAAPVAVALGIPMVQLGLFMVVATCVGGATPPVAIGIFSAASFSKLKLEEISKGEIPWFLGMLLVFLLIILFPVVTTIFV